MSHEPKRAVFLDRDGVINRAIVRDGKPYPPGSLNEVEILPGVPEALRRLRSAGFLLIVVTNQPDVARGTQTRETVEAINNWLQSQIPLDDFRVCFHDDANGCDCRKPEPGLILQASSDWNIDIANSFLVGDRWKDIEAGRLAGCKTILIDNKYDEAMQSAPDYTFSSLLETTDWILKHREAQSKPIAPY